MRNRLVACTAMSRPTLPLLQKFVERLTRCPLFLRSAEVTLTRLQAAFTIFNREVSIMITRRQFSAITLSIVAFMVLGPFARAASPTRIDLSTVLPDGNFHTQNRSEEHTSELQSLMRISYAVFCLKKKTQQIYLNHNIMHNNLTNNSIDHTLHHTIT